MSVLDDDVAGVRRKLAELRTERTDLRARLVAIPGWLWVGDPTHLEDDLRAHAEEAHGLQDGIDGVEQRILELTVELDTLDGEAPASSDPAPADPDARIGVLLPVRLETRFTRPDPDAAPGTPEAAWRLRVRVEPDPVVMAGRPTEVIRHEGDLVARCWAGAGGDLQGEDGAAAFAGLAGQVGAPRAAYLLRTVQVVPDVEGFRIVGELPERASVADPLLGLPPTLQIWGRDAAGLRLLLTLHPELEAIAGQSRLDALLDPDHPDTTRRAWWNSYEVAEAVELAGEIVLGEDTPAFDVLMCVGVARPGDGTVTPADLFGAHADAGRLGTLAPLTPTNTVAGRPTTDLGRDPEIWLEVARNPSGAAGGLAGALTGRPTLPGVPPPDLARQTAATALVRALWPVLWQRSLKDVAGLGPEVFRCGDWAGRHLHPFGPYPVVRVGDLPYGVLPIADFDHWTWRPADPGTGASDPVVERSMAQVLNHLVRPLVTAAEERGTAAGADAERLLEVLANVPVSREHGSRNLVPTVILATLLTGLGAEIAAAGPLDVIRQWDEQADHVRRILNHGPLRRYSPVSSVVPWPRKVRFEYRDLLKTYLESSWDQLAEAGDVTGHWDLDGERPAVLARLVRHALLLTQAELGRAWPDPGPVEYLLPLHRPSQMFDDARGGPIQDTDRVADVPASIAADVGSLDPRGVAVLRQFEDVRAAVIDGLVEAEPEPVAAALPAVLDCAGQRLDAWFTGLADRRLAQLTRDRVPPVIGVYGWVDDLRPSADPTPPTTAGLLHAPGYSQALASAVLRDHAVHEPDDTRWQIALHSTTIRLAAALGEQVRSGVHLSEALGREIERRVGEPGRVLDLRSAFPARPEWEGRRVCDGQQVLDATGSAPPPELAARVPGWLLSDHAADIAELRASLDTYADLLVADALHDVVDGRPAAAAESLEAAAGLGAPPELRLLRTQREGGTVRTKVLAALRWDPARHAAVGVASPAYVADPAVAEMLEDELGPPADWTWTDDNLHDPGVTTLELLSYSVADVLTVREADLTALAAERLGATPTGGTAPTKLAAAHRLLTGLGGSVVDPANSGHLLARLTTLRALAGSLVASLTDGTPGALDQARRWGLSTVDGAGAAADALQSRLTAIGPADTDAAAGADELARRIRTLLPTTTTLPLVCPAALPVLHHAPELDTQWLPVVAAVRPAIAGLEVLALTARTAWPGARSDASPIWAPPGLSEHGVAGDRAVTVVYGPGLGTDPAAASGTTVGLTLVDSWGETVPAQRHTSWASFGYDAPRARAPQAVLLVVPSDPTAPLGDDEAREAVLQARMLARSRVLTPPVPDALSLPLPTGMVLANTTTACVLTEEDR